MDNNKKRIKRVEIEKEINQIIQKMKIHEAERTKQNYQILMNLTFLRKLQMMSI